MAEEKHLFVLFIGSNPLRVEETEFVHGATFEKGYVYEVTERMFEFLKARRGFRTVRGIKKGMMDFKVAKRATVVGK